MLPIEKAQELQVSLLWYILRTGAHETFPEYWRQIKPHLDFALKANWENASKQGVKLETYLKAKKKC